MWIVSGRLSENNFRMGCKVWATKNEVDANAFLKTCKTSKNNLKISPLNGYSLSCTSRIVYSERNLIMAENKKYFFF